MSIITNSLITPTIINNTIVKSLISSIRKWFMKLDGTNYMELSEPKTFAGDFEIEISFSRTIKNTAVLMSSDVYGHYIQVRNTDEVFIRFTGGSVLFTPTKPLSDGTIHALNISHINNIAEVFIDGIQQTAFALSGSVWFSFLGQLNDATQKWIGTIYYAKLTDLATPSNSIEWKIDSGPPVYKLETDSYPDNPTTNLGVGWTGSGRDFSSVGVNQYVNAKIYIAQALHLGEYYEVTYRISNMTGGVLYLDKNSSASAFQGSTILHDTDGEYSELILCDDVNSNRGLVFNNASATPLNCDLHVVSVKEYVSTISDGTVYQDSETYGTEPDIMRPDDWSAHPSGVTVSGRTATFDGTQNTWSGVYANNQDMYAGGHALTVRVSVTQGGCQVRMGAFNTLAILQSTVKTFYGVADGPVLVQERGDQPDRFIGSVEIISIHPVPQGLIMWNVAAEDWEEV